ncbi:Lrp/AsnC family transcriptional regulator [Gilliamella sp. wkB112]|uniref:Lrp/AsnC family transcriptional regulator n=1 Tax=Gilliamella sp. wkB112 TaxID=3120257 RepID=UPI00080DA5EA|nr:AsnC family transcriptional regulator [Gilliamella apicola]OCG02950.1 hypothetical protein A9G12_08470 [Gilliamella apicola]
MDKKDRAILDQLKINSRQSWKEIGNKVFLSGQAVGQRVYELQANNVIEKFTIKEKTEYTQFITIFMNSNQFELFEKIVKSFQEILEFYKITGEGCYFIKSSFTPQNLSIFIEKIEPYCRYKVNHQLKAII